MIVRTLEYTIEQKEKKPGDAGDYREQFAEDKDYHPTIEQYLRTKGFSVQNCKELKKKKGLLLQNGEVVYINSKLSQGDHLTVHLEEVASSERIPPVMPTPEQLESLIIYEDEDILVINKPPGMPIHPSLHHSEDALANLIAGYYESKGRTFVYRCVNRLDQDTSGVTVIAKHFLAAGILGLDIKKHSEHHLAEMDVGKLSMRSGENVDADLSEEGICQKRSGVDQVLGGLSKEYLAIVAGCPIPAQGRLQVPIGRKDGSVIERLVDFENGEEAITEYEVMGEWERDGKHFSLMHLSPLTGRTHQLRIHMKHLGTPIIGDYLYAPDEMEYMHRQALHAWKLRIKHPITGQQMEFVAPLPPDMKKNLDTFLTMDEFC